LISMCRV